MSEQEALEEVVGPLGEEREDRRTAWLAFWIASALGGAKDIKPGDLLQHFWRWLRDERTDTGPDEIIVDDPDASMRKAKEIERKLLAAFPKGP